MRDCDCGSEDFLCEIVVMVEIVTLFVTKFVTKIVIVSVTRILTKISTAAVEVFFKGSGTTATPPYPVL